MSDQANLETALFLVGARLREPLMPEDCLTSESELHVGDFVVLDLGGSTAVAEVRRPKRPLPEFKRDRPYRRIVRLATAAEAAEWRERRTREVEGIETCRRLAQARGLGIKIGDVEIEPARAPPSPPPRPPRAPRPHGRAPRAPAGPRRPQRGSAAGAAAPSLTCSRPDRRPRGTTRGSRTAPPGGGRMGSAPRPLPP